PEKLTGPTTEEALSLSNARPGAQWWIPRTEEVQALPVDLTAVKAALLPTYQRLAREAQLTPGAVMGDKAAALQAIDRLMQAPDAAPLTHVDSILGQLKTFARSENPDLRTIGQGIVGKAVGALDEQVTATAKAAGPDVIAALEKGRAATKAKYAAADVLQGLETGRGEAVAAYRRLTAPGDSAIGQLRDVVKQAPEAAPKIARAFLDDLVGKATEGGAFNPKMAGQIDKAWRKLGPETKTALFQDRGYISDLDNYFRLARNIAENPNTSGTARIAGLYDLMSNAIGYPAAKLLYSPTGVKLLTDGLR